VTAANQRFKPRLLPCLISICGWKTGENSSRSSARRRLLFLFNHWTAWAFISSVKNRTLPRPMFLAQYMAASAFLIKVPVLAVLGEDADANAATHAEDCPWMVKLSFIASITRSAAIVASAGPLDCRAG